MDGRPPTYLSLLNRGQQAHGCVLVSMFIRLQEGTELSILARGDFMEERFDLGNSFLLQKNEQDCPELMAVLFPGAWQDGVGALDLAVVDSGLTHSITCVFGVSDEKHTLFCGLPNPPCDFFSSSRESCALYIGFVQVEGSLRKLIGLLFQLGRRFPL